MNIHHYLVIQEVEGKGKRRKERGMSVYVIPQEDEMLPQKTADTALNAVTVVTDD